MTLLNGRQWQLDIRLTLPENIRQGFSYFANKYGIKYDLVAMQPELRKHIKADMCAGLKIVESTRVQPGNILFARESE